MEVDRGKVEEGMGEDGREEERGTYDGEGAWIGRRTAVVNMVPDQCGGFEARGGRRMSTGDVVRRADGWDGDGQGRIKCNEAGGW